MPCMPGTFAPSIPFTFSMCVCACVCVCVCVCTQAVADDSRLRAFFTDSSQAAGLLIASAEGVPQLDRPLGK
jgi:hypothetical protein